MDYVINGIPSSLTADGGSSIVVINPGSSNIRIGRASDEIPLTIPHCIARHVLGGSGSTIRDKELNRNATQLQILDREIAYDTVAEILGIPYLDEEDLYPREVGRDGPGSFQSISDTAFSWTNVRKDQSASSSVIGSLENTDTKREYLEQPAFSDRRELSDDEYNYKEFICGDDALRISSAEPYCLSRPLRRGQFNISKSYPLQQVLEDLSVIWEWLLTEKLHIPKSHREQFAAVLVVPESLDRREIKEMLSIILRDLRFSSAVVHQEGLAAAFGSGFSTACVVNIGAQVTSVICIEDGAALPTTSVTLPYGGEDISRCLLWIQNLRESLSAIHTNPLGEPIDFLMLNKIKESYCQFKRNEFYPVADVDYYEEGRKRSQKTMLYAPNVPPMGLFYPKLLGAEDYPPPPRTWFHDYEEMLEDTANSGVDMLDNPVYSQKLKINGNPGLAKAIICSILATGSAHLKRTLFSSIQLVGGVSLTSKIAEEVESRPLWEGGRTGGNI